MSHIHNPGNLKKGLFETLREETKQEINLADISITDLIKGRVNKSTKGNVTTCARLLILQLFAIVFAILYRWMHVHFLKKSGTYFTYIWLENVLVVAILHLVMKTHPSSLPIGVKGTIRQLKSIWPLLFLYSIQVVVGGYDYILFTRKAGGTEFYQFCLVLGIPVLMAVMYSFRNIETPSYVYYVLIVLSGWKVMMLLQDPEFILPFTTSGWCLMFTFLYCCYLVMLNTYPQNPPLEVIYYLCLSMVFFLPVFIIANKEIVVGDSVVDISKCVEGILKGFMFASLKLCSMFSMLLVLKKSDPLTCLIIVNFAFIPDHFMQALVYKLDCTLATSKICVLMAIDFIVVQFKPNVPRLDHAHPSDRNFALMS